MTRIQVLPWNGHAAALSLTFDDGHPTQLDVAVPALLDHNLQGTFYLIAGHWTRIGNWKAAAAAGQEIGNHSMDHRHASDLGPFEAVRQVAEAKRTLEDVLGFLVWTFAYPYTEITPDLRRAASDCHLLCRGGSGPGYLSPASEPDWADLPSQVALSELEPGTYRGWIDTAVARRSWTIVQFHAFDGSASGWQPVTRRTFVDVLDYATANRSHLWIAPLGTVGTYWLAQKTVERATVRQEGKALVWKWSPPERFPRGVSIKVRAECADAVLSQGGAVLRPIAAAIYAVALDAGELRLEVGSSESSEQ
jgi:peptidoglycan-N-acetylglucosamine deacetylase